MKYIAVKILILRKYLRDYRSTGIMVYVWVSNWVMPGTALIAAIKSDSGANPFSS